MASVFSSHQLELVESLCESIVMMDRGRIVLEGGLQELRAASGRRMLRLASDARDVSSLGALEGVTVVRRDVSEVLLRLDSGADPLQVLDHARRLGTLHDFGLEAPRLSELFREAVES